jgi:phytoene synthase
MATQISSASASSSSDKSNNNNNNNNNIDQGRLLEGGKVIDFGNVKASNTAEQALADARRQLLTATSTSASSSSSSSSSPHHHHQYSDDILGINQQVIEEVGHALGTFASATEIQECAAWLRSQATTTCLERNDDNNNNNNNNNFDASQITRYQAIIDQAYFEAGEVTGAFAKTFYMGTMLLPEASRRAIWAIYVWCRRTDEIVDAPRENEQDMLVDLSSWEMRLERLWAFGEVVDVYDLCLLDVRTQYPTLDITPFMDMIRGMLMDVPGLGQDRYDTFDQLHLYCYRVAGTVGIMSLPVFGCAEGFTDDIAR